MVTVSGGYKAITQSNCFRNSTLEMILCMWNVFHYDAIVMTPAQSSEQRRKEFQLAIEKQATPGFDSKSIISTLRIRKSY